MLSPQRTRSTHRSERASLHEGWVIANHILVSFHVAFISSILALPLTSVIKTEVLRFIFLSPETLISSVFLYVTFHTAVAVHELGHFLTAARLNALNEGLVERVQAQLTQPRLPRLLYYVRLFVLAPYGRAEGIKRQGLNYYPDAPYNLAVAAAGPRSSRNLARAALPPAIALLALGLWLDAAPAIYAGRLLLGMGVVGLLDFFLADRGKYAEYRTRERRARTAAAAVAAETGADAESWYETAPGIKRRMLDQRLQAVVHPRLGQVTAPWQFRNCGMGGRHTEKEYPESNISMQEAMFLILGATDYQEAQEMTVRLQNRLKEKIEKEEGCRVMGIGLEGGLAPYIDRGDYPLPEIRLWALMRQTIEECGFRAGREVAIALDPAMSELEIAYRQEYNIPDAVGMYLFWRDKTKTVLDRDGVLAIYEQAIRQFDIPIIVIEDGYSENDYQGWQKLLAALGDRLFIIGDDLVTTNDRTIEMAAGQELINTALIKANQIGSLYETVIAMLVALGKGLELVVSHRSKSPNDDMEGQIALAANALGLKCGGGSNTERLVKYQAVASLMRAAADAASVPALMEGQKALVRKIWGYEEPTNAGIPTVGAEVELELPDVGIGLAFHGATPLGTSAGSGEAIHLVDVVIEQTEHREVVDAHPELFVEIEPRVVTFKQDVTADRVRALGDEELLRIFERAQRYQGKGCLNAVDNIRQTIAPYFTGRNMAARTIRDIDHDMLRLELRTAQRRGKLDAAGDAERAIQVMQRKQNLGMNAMLSVSLALARAIAHIQGKQLYEILREEMMALIARLASECDVPIAGSQWSDYVHALRQATAALEAEQRALHAELRRLTGIYAGDEAAAPAPLPGHDEDAAPAAATGGDKELAAAATAWETTGGDGAPAAERPPSAAPPPPGAAAAVITAEAPAAAPPAARPEPRPAQPLTAGEQEALATVTLALARAYRRDDGAQRSAALRRYLAARATLDSTYRRVAIVNNRLLRAGERLAVPYQVGDALVIHLVRDDRAEPLAPTRLPTGSILTDASIARLAGLDTAGTAIQPIDLEDPLHEFEVEQIEEVRISRIRDMAALLAQVNGTHNTSEAEYRLRFLAAGLSSLSFKAFLGAKNLQPEVRQLIDELARLLNGLHGRQPRFLTRVLVRNLSVLVLRPNLIDEVWNATIDLAEVQIRGSAIINELRRSSHHALGRHTLYLARAYLAYLESGATQPLADLGFDELSPADIEARQRMVPAEMLHRVVDNLEKLLGTSETLTRIEEWRDAYAQTLLRCEFGNTIGDELETLITDGIRARNRWTYLHHLRVITRKVESFELPPEAAAAARRGLAQLRAFELESREFDAERAAQEARDFVAGFVRTIEGLYQIELFRQLQAVFETYQQRAFMVTYERLGAVREAVSRMTERGGFAEQRCLLVQLDCLLEEIGYLALRHIAVDFDERGVDLPQCLDIIRRSISNLRFSGLASRGLDDLGAMLGDRSKTYAEMINILDQIQRLYHKILRRATICYEVMADPLHLSDKDLVVLLGNLKRYLHDLSTIARFCDFAREHIHNDLVETDRPVHSTPAPATGTAPPIVHLSDRTHIRKLLRDGINLRDAYGGKGSGLLYISLLGVPTRDGFILPTAIPRSGRHQLERNRFEQEILCQLETLERNIAREHAPARRFGEAEAPLLLAVRGGSVFSMPGMLTTIVFLGMNDAVAAALAERDPWQAYDAYRRFLASFAAAVWNVDLEGFDLVDEAKARHGVRFKRDLPWEAMREITEASKAILYRQGLGEQLEAALADPRRQLFDAVHAVLASWDAERATRYREIKRLCHTWHTAVIVQEMSSGNHHNDEVGEGMDEREASLTGVIPRTQLNRAGIRTLAGDIKFSAAGDDLVGGLTSAISLRPIEELRSLMPMLYRRMKRIVTVLRRYMGTDQEIEFTVDRGELSILQTRMAETIEEQQVHDFAEHGEVLTHGVGVRGSGFRGLVAFDEAGRAEMAELAAAGRDDVDGVLVVVENPTPDDIPLILLADGLLAARG